MNTPRKHSKLYRLALLVLLILTPAILQGCDGLNDEPQLDLGDKTRTAATQDAADKIRHRDLLDRAIRRDRSSKQGSGTMNLIIAVDQQRVLDPLQSARPVQGARSL